NTTPKWHPQTLEYLTTCAIEKSVLCVNPHLCGVPTNELGPEPPDLLIRSAPHDQCHGSTNERTSQIPMLMPFCRDFSWCASCIKSSLILKICHLLISCFKDFHGMAFCLQI